MFKVDLFIRFGCDRPIFGDSYADVSDMQVRYLLFDNNYA